MAASRPPGVSKAAFRWTPEPVSSAAHNAAFSRANCSLDKPAFCGAAALSSEKFFARGPSAAIALVFFSASPPTVFFRALILAPERLLRSTRSARARAGCGNGVVIGRARVFLVARSDGLGGLVRRFFGAGCGRRWLCRGAWRRQGRHQRVNEARKA